MEKFTIFSLCLLWLALAFQCIFSVNEKPDIVSECDPNTTAAEVCEQMRTYDAKIIQTLETLPEGGGDQLFKDLELYNEAAQKYVDFVVYKRDEAVEAGRDLIKETDPRFSKLPIDNSKFKEKFKWTDAECDRFKEMRWKAMDTWKMVHIFT